MGAFEQLYVTSMRSTVLDSYEKNVLMVIMNVGFTANLDSLYDLSRCLEDLGSLSKRPKAVVEVEKVKSCRKFL